MYDLFLSLKVFYIQLIGYGDLTKLNIPCRDYGRWVLVGSPFRSWAIIFVSELVPHGAYSDGNPIGGNITSNILRSDMVFAEWMVIFCNISDCWTNWADLELWLWCHVWDTLCPYLDITYACFWTWPKTDIQSFACIIAAPFSVQHADSWWCLMADPDPQDPTPVWTFWLAF